MYCVVLHVVLLFLPSYLLTFMDLFRLIQPDFSKVFGTQKR